MGSGREDRYRRVNILLKYNRDQSFVELKMKMEPARVIMILQALAKVTYGEDQTVIELKKTVANLNDVKMYLKDILQVEEKLFSLISQNVSTGGQRTTNIVEKNVVGREGETLTLKCRSRSSISWKHADDDGRVSQLPDVSRKIKVVVTDENAGVYQCFAGN